MQPTNLEHLSAPVTNDEICKTVFQLARHKALGPDGITSEVLQIYWRQMKVLSLMSLISLVSIPQTL
jgi:hypothetical protein